MKMLCKLGGVIASERCYLLIEEYSLDIPKSIDSGADTVPL